MIITHGNRRLDVADDRSDRSRLDAGEGAFLLRQLEAIDTRMYLVKYPALLGRTLIPAQDSVPDWAHVYTYRLYDQFGIAKVIANAADDLNQAEITGAETQQRIVPIGMGYGYDVFEIQAAAATGISLDQARAMAARYAAESAVDMMLATGKVPAPNGTPTAVPGVTGLFTLTGTTAFTLGTKALGGTTWGTVAAPNATGDEVAADIMGIANNLFEATKQLFASFKIVMTPAMFNYANTKRLGSVSDTTALAFAKANCPYISDIVPWWQAPSGNIIAFPNDPTVVSCIVNQEFTITEPVLRNLKYVRNGYMKCGGVISKYPVAISKATGA